MPTVRKKKKNLFLAPVCSVEAVKEKGRATGEGGVEGITRETTEVSNRVGKDGPSSESQALTPEQWLAALSTFCMLHVSFRQTSGLIAGASIRRLPGLQIGKCQGA